MTETFLKEFKEKLDKITLPDLPESYQKDVTRPDLRFSYLELLYYKNLKEMFANNGFSTDQETFISQFNKIHLEYYAKIASIVKDYFENKASYLESFFKENVVKIKESFNTDTILLSEEYKKARNLYVSIANLFQYLQDQNRKVFKDYDETFVNYIEKQINRSLTDLEKTSLLNPAYESGVETLLSVLSQSQSGIKSQGVIGVGTIIILVLIGALSGVSAVLILEYQSGEALIEIFGATLTKSKSGVLTCEEALNMIQKDQEKKNEEAGKKKITAEDLIKEMEKEGVFDE